MLRDCSERSDVRPNFNYIILTIQMINNHFTNIVFGDTAWGLYVSVDSAKPLDEFNCSLVQLKKKKKSVELTGAFHNVPFHKLGDYLSKKQAVYLVVDGKGVVAKRVIEEDSLSMDQLFDRVIPNANKAEFYSQLEYVSQQEVHIALCRCRLVESIVEQLSRFCFVKNVSLAYLPVLTFRSLFQNENVYLPSYTIHSKEKSVAVEKTINDLESISVDGEILNAFAVLPYLQALKHFTNSTDTGTISNWNALLSADFFYAKLLKKGLVAALSFLLVLLVFNFIIFSELWEQDKTLQAELDMKQDFIRKLSENENELAKRQAVLQEGYVDETRFSFYIDSIATTIPEKMVLRKLVCNPLLTKKMSRNDLQFSKNTITIEGDVGESHLFNSWLKKLKQFAWISKVSIADYAFIDESGSASFSVEIGIKQKTWDENE